MENNIVDLEVFKAKKSAEKSASGGDADNTKAQAAVDAVWAVRVFRSETRQLGPQRLRTSAKLVGSELFTLAGVLSQDGILFYFSGIDLEVLDKLRDKPAAPTNASRTPIAGIKGQASAEPQSPAGLRALATSTR